MTPEPFLATPMSKYGQNATFDRKVVETSTWAQKMRDMQVYFGTYNMLKR